MGMTSTRSFRRRRRSETQAFMRNSFFIVASTSLVTVSTIHRLSPQIFCPGTNFPAELYDGHLFGKESYYEELARAQKEEMDRREKAAEARRKAGDHRPREPAVVTNRKSKWDQGVSHAH